MSREDMALAATKIIAEHPAVTNGDAADLAWDVLAAILPQVTTVAELAELPLWSTVVAPTVGDRAWVFKWNGRGLYDPDTEVTHEIGWLVERYGPLTVVWQPEVTS